MDLDWNDVKSVVLKDSSGNTLKTNPEIWCGERKQWPVDIPVAAPYQTGQTGNATSGTAVFNIDASTKGISFLTNTTASDTSAHYANVGLKAGYCWDDGYQHVDRSVQFRLSKYTRYFYVAGSGYSVSGFNQSADYEWDEAINAGLLPSSFSVGTDGYVLCNGKAVVNSSGFNAHRYDVISGSYTLKKPTVDFDVSIYNEGGYLFASISGYAPSGVEPSYRWHLGSKTLGTDYYLHIDIDDFTSDSTNLDLEVTYPETSDYAESKATDRVVVYCRAVDNAKVSSDYSSECKARLLRVGHGTNYFVFRINGLPSSSGYTRYSFRKSSKYNESAWGKDTYFRRYYLSRSSYDSYQTLMKHAKYSGSEWVDSGTSTYAWGDVIPSKGKVQIWLEPDTSAYYCYFGNKVGVSGPPN